ncbi:hypothetical protein BH24DEI1_BH24DEI1_09290 [soil metagenome]
MDDKRNQAADIPVPAADQADQDERHEAQAAVAEQGAGNVADETQNDARPGDEQSETPPLDSLEAQLDAKAEDAFESEGAFESEQALEFDREPELEVDLEPESFPEDVGASTEATGMTAESEAVAQPDQEETAYAGDETAQEQAQSAVDGGPTDQADQGSMMEAREREITMEDVIAASDDQLARKPIHRGMVTTGTVIMLSQDGVIVDVGAKIEGLIPYNQLYEFEVKADEAAKYVKSGDQIQVYVVRADIPNNTIILSKKRADQEKAWNLLQDIFEKGLPVEVEIVEKVRGGLVANLGVRAFLPASQIDVRRINDLSPYVDKRLKVRIIELNRKRNRVIISRRSIIEEEMVGVKEETLRRLEPGVKLEGEVVEITDFGVFVNLGGVEGLVHRSEIGYGRFNHPKEVLKVGDKVHVEVLDMDLERERINLSMKKLIADPWENVLTTYSVGQKVGGSVTNLTPFGAFVEIEPGLEGLIHVSEMSWTKRVRHPKEVLTEGDLVEAMILKVDMAQKRISLGLRQTQPDPWSSLPDRYPPGTEVTGPITGITEFGVFMEIEEGIEGLIHISELAHERIDDVAEHFKRGDEVTAVILNIDPIEQRASLSRKRLMPYTAAEGEGGGDYAYAGGGQRQSPGGRKGRRGGRRSSEIDYDYSYAATDAGGKTTTKLGDVYADLFAQFGLADKKEPAKPEASPESAAEAGETPAQAEAPATDAATDTAAAQPVAEAPETVAPAAETPEAAAEVEPQPEEAYRPVVEARPEEDQDPENAIDAAEAAALLTAAFRQGRRPVAEQTEREETADEEEKLEESKV